MRCYCSCGRSFRTAGGREDHQTAAKTNGSAPSRSLSGANYSLSIVNTSSNVVQAGNTTERSPLVKAKQQAWLWKQIRRPTQPVYIIVQSAIIPSTKAVTSEAGYQLVCSYNWQGGKPFKIRVPGHAAICQDMSLPLTLQPDKGTYFIDLNAAMLPQHPFEPMFRAAYSMNPDASFDDVDIVTNRNSLRKLLDFSAGRSGDYFRLNLHLVRNTLIIERRWKRTREFIDDSREKGWGKSFEEASAQFPAGLEHSLGYHRTLRYSLGALSCAVQFEVDACFDSGSKPGPLDDLVPRMETVSIPCDQPGKAKGPQQGVQVETVYHGARVMDQSTTAELKSTCSEKRIKQVMPQLWFGRTPWLIVGRHTNGTFDDVKITNVTEEFAEWEATKQEALRKLVTLLEELRTAIRRNGGRPCAAVLERRSGVIGVFDLMNNNQAVPADLRQKLWNRAPLPSW
ncbi:hypothetical protein LX32DRAFT_702301 [Colletotrichum zoysiae]|uniref:Geranylgeranyl pyrophosphate synthetase n=1 Tax=Colletotrichum zoysiae TaxID=1216348 RepID=A0AAD9HD74_9PEZI|nr:hypothetical protein LX32DRAFT_702301 [Colletotrichum zoysiae]